MNSHPEAESVIFDDASVGAGSTVEDGARDAAPLGRMGWPALSKLARLTLCMVLAACAAAPALAQRLATGTGFFVTADGYFVTCHHVIGEGNSVTVRNLKGETFPARVVQIDRANDLAVLKVEGRFKPLPVSNSADVRRGAAIVTMGFPNVRQQGIEPKVTDGIINSFSGVNNDVRLFQISAPVQPGNSGGPLVTMDGNVVGVVAAKLDAQAVARVTGDIPQNVNYAIKSQYLSALIERAAAAEPGLRAGLVAPRVGESTRVVDVVPALEDAIALVVASTGPAALPRPFPAPGQAAPDDERSRRADRLAAEYRQLQGVLGQLNLEELTLTNQAHMLRLMLRFDAPGTASPREAELAATLRRLDDVGSRKQETVRRLNEIAAEYRGLQAQPGRS
ncbi:MAG: trypsin-like peptidase domain-containing protein [Burkholderiales bacterium]|nr:trypsin-like peptidase domain-containing protein [Burkholderiales bacterium]